MKVFFIDTVHPILWEQLLAHQFECIDATKWDNQRVLASRSEMEGIVIRSRFLVDANFLAECEKLEFVARSGSGLENIDLEEAKRKSIQVFSSPEGNAGAVGEHAMALLLNLLNNIHSGDAAVRNGTWPREEHRGIELEGKIVGIIGLGHTGSSFAKKLSGFDCRVIAYDKYKPANHAPDAERVEMEELYKGADIVSIHLPQTAETTYLVNKEWLDRFRKPIIFLNTARGKNVQTRDLVTALKSGQVTAAGLDVLEYEKHSFEGLNANELPLSFQELCSMPNVLLSPHVAGWTKESYVKLSSTLSEKIIAHFRK